jgi:hypothetical protein
MWSSGLGLKLVQINFIFTDNVCILCIYIRLKIKLFNQTVLELDFRAVKFLFFRRRDYTGLTVYIFIIYLYTLTFLLGGRYSE